MFAKIVLQRTSSARFVSASEPIPVDRRPAERPSQPAGKG
jgi:hypothetical protein